MFLNQSAIRSLGNRFARLARDAEIYVYHVPEDIAEALLSIGMPADSDEGDTILPTPSGTVSTFNADGAWRTHKDRPKEARVTGQRVWRWRQWRGRYGYEDHERIVDIVRDCYPRTFIDPPAVEMQLRTVDGDQRLTSLVPANSSDELLKHTVNLHLELFGSCYVTNNADERPQVAPRRVNWRILPPGEDPWNRVRGAVQNRQIESDDSQQIILDRQQFICSFGPSEVFVGLGGFNDYLAYIFPEKNIVVLESVQRGNAIYVFDQDWRNLSQLSKREIIHNQLQEARIIHSTGWKQRLRNLMAER